MKERWGTPLRVKGCQTEAGKSQLLKAYTGSNQAQQRIHFTVNDDHDNFGIVPDDDTHLEPENVSILITFTPHDLLEY